MTFADILPKILTGGKFFRPDWYQTIPAQGATPERKVLKYYVTAYKVSDTQTMLVRVSEAAGQIGTYNPGQSNMTDKQGDILATDWEQLQ